MTTDTQDRVVLVTGAAGGIGSAIATALIDAGHSVAAVDRNVVALEQLCAKHSSTRNRERLLPITADLAFEEACSKAVAKTISHFGRIEVVINNAGIGVSSIRGDAELRHPSIEELTTEVWDQFFAINVRAAMIVTRIALPHVRKRKWGRIINNTTSYRTMLRVLPYGATKAALESMSAVWATELNGSGITVNVLVPGGPTDTSLIADASGWPRDKMLRPEIMAPPACWLISDNADLVTGQRITASDWDVTLPGVEAVRKAGRAIGWPELAAKPRSWQG
jgi:NAD(P)-dependent dehydrogenase (short-subunit alcohol dehydrogenase family)